VDALALCRVPEAASPAREERGVDPPLESSHPPPEDAGVDGEPARCALVRPLLRERELRGEDHEGAEVLDEVPRVHRAFRHRLHDVSAKYASTACRREGILVQEIGMETSLIVLGVFSDGDRWLVVEERDGTWYLPAGRVEPGEDLIAAVMRETVEEAAQVVAVEGLLGIDHSSRGSRARIRFAFAGRRAGSSPPKACADEHTRSAAWLTRERISRLPLRHPEVLEWIDRRAAGGALMPAASYAWMI
jgi:ADP-ribose pyrophosphatase YjhB (NUDIX family)